MAQRFVRWWTFLGFGRATWQRLSSYPVPLSGMFGTCSSVSDVMVAGLSQEEISCPPETGSILVWSAVLPCGQKSLRQTARAAIGKYFNNVDKFSHFSGILRVWSIRICSRKLADQIKAFKTWKFRSWNNRNQNLIFWLIDWLIQNTAGKKL
jgi:hypothetical protein